ncbi:LysE family translocator [Pendulispora brunnea]|uniref:LysE family translocator n=1 Tax=Pendulispora brunnea TaxID=2905690 RepID=A0ABZ2KGW6_9BACT
MLTLAQFTGFLAAALLITLSPGPDNLMVLSLGASRGRRHGMVFGFGCAMGCLSHTLLAVLGVSALIAASPVAFTALKMTGGLYLVWLGINAIRSRGASLPAEGGPSETNKSETGSLGTVFRRGLVANAINPKVVLFFLSFLPQFVDPSRGHVSLQTGLLGILFAVQAAVLFGTLGYFAGAIGAQLRRRPTTAMWLDRVAGSIFIALGIKLAVSR